MSFQQLLDDIDRVSNMDRATARNAVDFDDDDFDFLPPPRPNFAKAMTEITARLERTRKRGRRLAKATGSVWDKLTPTGDDQPRKPPDYDKFLDRCAAAMKAGEITGEELIVLEGVVNRMKAGMVA